MKRIVVIDGCSANIIFPAGCDAMPLQTTTVEGGWLVRAAVELGKAGRHVVMMGEAGRDRLGDLIVGRLEDSGVDVSCIDRYSDGAFTPSLLIFPSESGEVSGSSIVYMTEMAERWDSKWPRIDSDDIIVFGGYFALQPRVRTRLVEFITYARERGALIVNVPGYNPSMAPAVTRIMPAVLEDFEMADVVFSATPDIDHIFPGMTPEKCYLEKISFYSRLMANVDLVAGSLTVMCGDMRVNVPLKFDSAQLSPLFPAQPLAHFIDALSQTEVRPQLMQALTSHVIESIAEITTRQALTSNIEL